MNQRLPTLQVPLILILVAMVPGFSYGFCPGALYVGSESSVSSPGNCPDVDPSLDAEFNYHCEDECGFVGQTDTVSGSAYGDCVGYGGPLHPPCMNPIKCLPQEGVGIHSYNPPAYDKSLVNYRGEGPCGDLRCHRDGTTVLHAQCPCGNINNWCHTDDPLILSLVDDELALTDLAGGVRFDLNRDGEPELVPWTAAGSDEAFLVLDRNGDGLITSCAELFGDVTAQHPSAEPNGFRALALFDEPFNGGNGDGRLDRRDAIFEQLRLWQDANHNGFSEDWEPSTLAIAGVQGFELDYQRVDLEHPSGNELRYRARATRERGKLFWVWNVFFVAD